jgi:hypothetical protein
LSTVLIMVVFVARNLVCRWNLIHGNTKVNMQVRTKLRW